MKAIRLLVVDDHALFREGLAALFSTTTDMEMVGEAASGHEVLVRIEECHPDVVLMDISMPDIDGTQVTREIVKASPETAVVMVTMLEDDASVFSAMRAGARGYVLKGASHEELLQTIRAAAGGQVLFGPNIASRMMGFFQNLALTRSQSAAEDVFPELTDREREVLELIAQGVANSQIAEKLVISTKTVRNHITSIFSKLQVAERSQAIVKAREAGLGQSNELDD